MNCKAYLIFFIAALFLIMPVQAADPIIDFISPTEANNTVIYVDHTLINTTVSDADGDNLTALLNWNNSLVGWWRMNEGTGNVVEDFSGNGNNGSFTDGVTGNWTTDGKFGDAWVGDGVNDVVNCGTDVSLNMSQHDYSIELWVKGPPGQANYRRIYDKSGTAWITVQTVVNHLYVRLDDDWGNPVGLDVISTDILDNKWHHISIVALYNDSLYIYIDSQYTTSTSITSLVGNISPTGNVRIGGNVNFFNGSIDEVRVYNRALSHDEINASYNASAYRLFNNFTGLADGEYNYTAYVQDENGNVNSTETRYLTVDAVFTPTVELLSQTPGIIQQNSTGDITQVWGINHTGNGLNYSSIAYTFGMYDVIDDIYKFNLRTPGNNKAAYCSYCGENILRGINRNESLTWENNATITAGNITTWNGYDFYSSEVTTDVINSTYTNVTITGLVQHQVFPFSTYLDNSDLREAPKTGFPIHKTSYAVVKFWDNEAMLDHTHLGFAYVDAYIGTTPPTENIEVFYLNDSFDTAGAVHPDDSPYLFYLTSMNATEWDTNHYTPHANASYVNSIVVNSTAIENSGINVTGKAYLYFRSDTASSKPYYINVTDVASSTNVSFNETEVLWTVVSTPFSITQEAYTPNIFTSFMHPNMQYQSKLWVQDDNGLWGNSSLETTNIDVSVFPPSTPGFDYLCVSGVPDYDKDGTYNGIIGVGIGVSNDPDGGAVDHNLTLHYDDGTFVATINNTFTNEDVTSESFICIDFDTSAYYSDTLKYTLKVVATDDESDTSEAWLGVNFTLSTTPATADEPIGGGGGGYLGDIISIIDIVDAEEVVTGAGIRIGSPDAGFTIDLVSISNILTGKDKANTWTVIGLFSILLIIIGFYDGSKTARGELLIGIGLAGLAMYALYRVDIFTFNFWHLLGLLSAAAFIYGFFLDTNTTARREFLTVSGLVGIFIYAIYQSKLAVVIGLG